ncbi:hypothetical protein ARC23_12615 [Stenotrophomonas beteli]|uniref:Cupin-like domain-containing protein n=1 Tax=Stenotrophomonas beteli TaxID=3384461 RepID=A0A0R0AYB3_9GAMM|nr:hypothetical protein ARC23_12615 [Stenotrophomonas maltophilia]
MDVERFPRFHQALAQAHVAEPAPGDAVYIPSLWWRHVLDADVLTRAHFQRRHRACWPRW